VLLTFVDYGYYLAELNMLIAVILFTDNALTEGRIAIRVSNYIWHLTGCQFNRGSARHAPKPPSCLALAWKNSSDRLKLV